MFEWYEMSESQALQVARPLVLVFDAAPKQVEAYRHIFLAMDVEMRAPENAEQLRTQAIETQAAMLLIDAAVSQPDAFQLINSLKADKRIAHIPVVLVTSGFSDRRLKLYPALESAVEILPKPFEIEQFFALIKFYLQQYRYRRIVDQIGDKSEGSIIESDTEALLALDAEGKILFANYAAECILRGRSRFLVGKYMESMLDEPVPALVSHWQEHPIKTVTGKEQILQIDSATLWRADGEPIHAKFAAIPLFEQEEIRHVIAFRETKETRESKEKIASLSHSDTITGLPTRVRFQELMDKLLQKARQRNHYCAILHVDLDHFRNLNESLGHEIGDQLLVQVTARIKQLIRREDVVGRMESDEFVIAMGYIEQPENAGLVARKLVDRLREPYLLRGHEIYSSASVGIAIFPQSGDSVDVLIKNAKTATHRAKVLGRSTYQYFTVEMNKELAYRLRTEFELRKALEKQELLVSLRPVVDVAKGRVMAYTVALQWPHAKRGLLEAAEFASVAEDAGLSADLCKWQWQKGLSLARQQQVKDNEPHVLIISASQAFLSQEDIVPWLIQAVKDAHIDPARIVVALAEGVTMTREQATVETLLTLRKQGFEFAIDEFGTGFASLQMLRRIPFSAVVLSDALVSGLGNQRTEDAIVDGILYLAKQLGLQVLAPGVSNEQQAAFLQLRGACWQSGAYVEERIAQPDYVEATWEFPGASL
ncbi:Predicted response regulator [gamma proteobacterium HdN1]|nr:Predicted response regulator [gamma proteobacterium HdN1]